MAEYDRVAVVVMVIGYLIDLLTLMTSSSYYVSSDHAVEAMFIIAFLLYTTATVLVLIVTLTDLQRNIAAVLATTAMTFLASVFIVVGLSVFASDIGQGAAPAPYQSACYSVSLLLAVAAGLFLTLHVTDSKASRAADPHSESGVMRVREASK